MDTGDAEFGNLSQRRSIHGFFCLDCPAPANLFPQVFCLQLRYWLTHQELETIEQVGEELGGQWCPSTTKIEARS